MNSTYQAAAAAPTPASTRPAEPPHRLIARLLDGAMERLDRAGRELPTGSGDSLPAAVAIIEALQDSLDLARGGQLAANLFDLYDYMLRRLDEAGRAGNPAPLAEVNGLLETIREGWEAIAPQVESVDT